MAGRQGLKELLAHPDHIFTVMGQAIPSSGVFFTNYIMINGAVVTMPGPAFF